jgi:hypothetical protein
MAIRPTTVTLNKQSPRYGDWMKVFGCATVEVTAALPRILDIRGERREAFLVNLKALDDGQRRRLVEHLAGKFGAEAAEVEQEIDAVGLPILTEDTTWSMDLRWFV